MQANKIGKSTSTRLWMYTVLYIFIGLLFVIKYPGRYGFSPLYLGLAYIAFVAGGTWLLRCKAAFLAELSGRRQLLMVMAITAGLLLLMLQFDPESIRNARYKLLNQAIGMLLNGTFPYGAPMPAHHSAFPFWYAIALPFYVIGDTGLLQILTFFLGGFILLRLDSTTSPAGILALAASPAFIYEITVRSGLAGNMILVLVYLHLIKARLTRHQPASVFIIGLIGGLLLSTRGVVFLIFAIYLGHYTKNNLRSGWLLLAGWLLSFSLTMLPFLLWDGARFLAVGPMMHQLQLTRLTGWLILPALLAVFLVGRKSKTITGVFEATGLFLFSGVAASFCASIISNGLAASIMDSRFDISYFCLALPFIIVGWMRALRPDTA
jgi:hypothetical protein